MADINIPGISDKYKTNDLVNSLVEVEKIPLKREQDKLEAYKTEQSNWRRLNQYMSSLRESARSLYSYDNPFNERTASSSEERAITASPTRDANLESFRIDVIQTAASDRFLSKKIDKNQIIPEGTYKFTVGEKTITYRWKGGKISDFSTGLNKRGNGVIKSSFIGVSKNETSFLIESLKTGSENKLIFEDDAFKMALDLGIVEEDQSEIKQNILKESFSVGPQSENEVKIDDALKEKSSILIRFRVNSEKIDEEKEAQINQESNDEKSNPITSEKNKSQGNFAGKITFKDITVYNDKTSSLSAKDLGEDYPLDVAINDANLDNEGNSIEQKEAIIEPSYEIIFAKMKDGSVKNLGNFNENYDEKSFSFKISEYSDIDSIFIQNKNPDRKFTVSDIQYIDVIENLGYKPVNAISEAQDAIIKYEGITMERPSNEIDDIIENITLELHEPTSKTATITIENDAEHSKDALITFVGNYNQLLTELNILTQLKPEVVDEIEYFSDDEKEAAMERLGAFQTDSTLRSNKASLQSIISGSYAYDEDTTIRTLAQLGISTKTSASSSISAQQLRGYLEIDEKKLDEALKGDMVEIKNLFGYDSDGDMVVDSGIAYRMDKILQSYVQTGGIIALKTSSIDRQIDAQQSKIRRLEDQVADKETALKRRYGSMESTLNNLQSQANSISNFANQGNGN